MTDDWAGRKESFEDNKDLVIFKDLNDLNEKISYYLKNWEEAQNIAAHGHQTVQNFTRDNWAKRILELYEQNI